jgi:hypothetical protein
MGSLLFQLSAGDVQSYVMRFASLIGILVCLGSWVVDFLHMFATWSHLISADDCADYHTVPRALATVGVWGCVARVCICCGMCMVRTASQGYQCRWHHFVSIYSTAAVVGRLHCVQCG